MDAADVHRRLETVWRMEFPALVAMVTRIVGDLSTAEDIVQDVSVIALDQWRRDGMPREPAPWLRATAKHRAIDVLRRRHRTAVVIERAGLAAERRAVPDPSEEILAHPVTDDLLQLIFLTCHPALTRESQVALTLRLFGGLSSAEIARAFLVPEATVAQRISRAKRTLRDASAGLELPVPDQLPGRVVSVGAVVYLIFNEGYAATSGDWTRPDLCAEAIRLGRILTSLLPGESELHGLSALMQLHASRLPARIDAAGRPVLLADQDRRLWDRLLIRQGVSALERAIALGGALRPYALQASIAACHARAVSDATTDWDRITALYTVLAHVAPSPIIELNRAVAVGRSHGPAAGLAILDEVTAADALGDYPQLPAVRADLLERAGRPAAAAAAYRRAAELTRNEGERSIFLTRAAALEVD
ncbi:MAG TPA: sigma-70 family RNA polymerase sigma factor [Microlunatus sp.]